MDFEVLKATYDLADDLGYIHACSWQEGYKGIIPDDYLEKFTPEKRAEKFRDSSLNFSEFYLFKSDGKPAGIAGMHKDREENSPDENGEVGCFYFHPDFWGKGCAAKGMEFCVTRLKELGYKKIILWVLKDNKRARKFYEKQGFEFDGTEKEIVIGKPLIEIRYQKHI